LNSREGREFWPALLVNESLDIRSDMVNEV